jgi:hypothetical protein
MTSRLWPRITLAVAAAASVATSQLPQGWWVSGSAPLDQIDLDGEHTKAVYAIHIEVTGTGPYTDLAGDLTPHLSARATGLLTTQAVLRVTMRSITNPGVETVEDRMLPDSSGASWTELPAWTHCATPPCVEDLELTVELIGTDALSATVTGTIDVSARGDNYDLERTTQVTINASPLP